MARGRKAAPAKGNGANVGFEDKLWAAADKLHNNMDDAESKHLVPGLGKMYFTVLVPKKAFGTLLPMGAA